MSLEPAWRVDRDRDWRRVHGVSTARLPFEPRGAMVAYRDELRGALADLTPASGEGLTATYLSPDVEFVDVENVALYNLGTSCWTHLAASGLVCGRGASFDGLHHLLYRVGPLTEPLPAWDVPVATVTAPVVDRLPRTAFGWWQLLRPGLVAPAGNDLYGGEFVTDVRIGKPAGVQLAGLVKPLLDGLVMALSSHDGSNADALRPALAAFGDPDELWALLCDPASAPHGPRPLLRPRNGPAGFAVNPADERLAAFSIRPAAGTGITVTVRRPPVRGEAQRRADRPDARRLRERTVERVNRHLELDEHAIDVIRDAHQVMRTLSGVRPDELTALFHATQYDNLTVVVRDLLGVLGVDPDEPWTGPGPAD